MAEIQVFKTKITNACALLRSNEPEITKFNQGFSFPPQIEECKAYIREKTALLNHLTKSINSAKQFHDACAKEAIETINVFTKDKLTTTTRTANLSEEDRNFIKGKKISIAQRNLLNVSPDILVGQDLLHQILDHNAADIKLPSGLVLTPTIFGYTISGTSGFTSSTRSNSEAQCSSVIVATPLISSKDDYKMDIKHLYELESLGINTDSGTDEASVIKFMEDYRKNHNYREWEHHCRISVHRRKGIIEEADNFSNSVANFYLPQRYVWTPSKSTKLRVVFDASSHAKDECSLNDVIFEGHSLTPLIHEVVLQIRTHLYTMEHRDVTRFIWVKDTSLPPAGNNLKYFRFCRVPFGINASPAILHQSILKHTEGSHQICRERLFQLPLRRQCTTRRKKCKRINSEISWI
ncbi:hypothetical protein OSTOST_00505 [Ostertagia ostertagi]